MKFLNLHNLRVLAKQVGFITIIAVGILNIAPTVQLANAQTATKKKPAPAPFADLAGIWRTGINHLPSKTKGQVRQNSVLNIQLDGQYTIFEGTAEVLKSSLTKKDETTYLDGEYEFILSPTKTVLTVKSPRDRQQHISDHTNTPTKTALAAKGTRVTTYARIPSNEVQKYLASEMLLGHYARSDCLWIFSKTGHIYRWSQSDVERSFFYSFEKGELSTTNGDGLYFETIKGTGMNTSKRVLQWRKPYRHPVYTYTPPTDSITRIGGSLRKVEDDFFERKGFTPGTPTISKSFISPEKGILLEIRGTQARLTNEVGEVKDFIYTPLGNTYGELLSKDGEWFMLRYQKNELTLKGRTRNATFKVK